MSKSSERKNATISTNSAKVNRKSIKTQDLTPALTRISDMRSNLPLKQRSVQTSKRRRCFQCQKDHRQCDLQWPCQRCKHHGPDVALRCSYEDNDSDHHMSDNSQSSLPEGDEDEGGLPTKPITNQSDMVHGAGEHA